MPEVSMNAGTRRLLAASAAVLLLQVVGCSKDPEATSPPINASEATTSRSTPLRPSTNTQPPQIYVNALHLDHVENPSELDRWRKQVLDTKETRAIGDTITSYYGCTGCYSMVGNALNKVAPLPSGGIEHKGVIQAPPGYTVCRAYAKSPSVNCNGTLTGSYRTADDPVSAHLDGL
jgi:hypothetical protein